MNLEMMMGNVCGILEYKEGAHQKCVLEGKIAYLGLVLHHLIDPETVESRGVSN